MNLKWYPFLLCSSFCLCRGASIAPSRTYVQNIEKRNISHWATHNEHPSPIDIRTEDVKEKPLPPINDPFGIPSFDSELVECMNDGMTLSCHINDSSATLRGGPLKDEYVFDTMHFHWGQSDLNGSEHTINGQRFASELHAIFRNKKYPDLKTAAEMKDGLTILTWFGMESDDEGARSINFLFTLAEKLIEFKMKVLGFAGRMLRILKQLIEPLLGYSSDNWITYDGALTMEPYSDSVKWIIFDRPYAISHRQLEILRHMKREDGTPNLEHSKEIGPLRGRSLFKPIGGKFNTDVSSLKKHIIS